MSNETKKERCPNPKGNQLCTNFKDTYHQWNSRVSSCNFCGYSSPKKEECNHDWKYHKNPDNVEYEYCPNCRNVRQIPSPHIPTGEEKCPCDNGATTVKEHLEICEYYVQLIPKLGECACDDEGKCKYHGETLESRIEEFYNKFRHYGMLQSEVESFISELLLSKEKEVKEGLKREIERIYDIEITSTKPNPWEIRHKVLSLLSIKE